RIVTIARNPRAWRERSAPCARLVCGLRNSTARSPCPAESLGATLVRPSARRSRRRAAAEWAGWSRNSPQSGAPEGARAVVSGAFEGEVERLDLGAGPRGFSQEREAGFDAGVELKAPHRHEFGEAVPAVVGDEFGEEFFQGDAVQRVVGGVVAHDGIERKTGRLMRRPVWD